MTVTVNIWLPDGLQLGHASMTLHDKTHISWWPSSRRSLKKKTDGGILSSPANTDQTFNADKEMEGRDPEHVFYIDDLNEAAISRWWSDFELGHSYWNALTMNCCTVVYWGLCHGDSRFREIHVGFCPPWWTPEAIENLLKKYLYTQRLYQ